MVFEEAYGGNRAAQKRTLHAANCGVLRWVRVHAGMWEQRQMNELLPATDGGVGWCPEGHGMEKIPPAL